MGSPLIVLTASASEASEWGHSIWQQMVSATIPDKFRGRFLKPETLVCESWPDGRAKYVPNGTRVVEALLRREYDEKDVVVCYHEYLDRFVGPETKVVGIHAHNPLGISYATDVYSKLCGENHKPVNAAEFLKIVKHPVLEQYRPKIIVGGPGAWQLEKQDRLDEFRIDHLIDGEIERVFADLFKRIIDGDPTLERIIKIPKTSQPSVEEIPVVRHRSTFGVVEITRGCGRGCQFCSPAVKVGRSFPLEHIVANARVNAEEGATELMIATEDMFLYEQGPNFTPNIDALNKMLKACKDIRGIETLQMSHITMAPVVRHPDLIERITPNVVPHSHVHHEWSTDPNKKISNPIIGLETGSPRLFETFMKGKAYPYKAHQWPDVILKGMETLNKHNWHPFCTFIIGLPGETDDDTRASLDLLYSLQGAKALFVPTWFVPLENTRMQKKESVKLIEMTDLQWEFFFTCWKYNVDYMGAGITRPAWHMKVGVPLYYQFMGRRLFGKGMKYPLARLAGVSEKILRKKLYLDLSDYKHHTTTLPPFGRDIIPEFETIKGLNMVDAAA